MNQTRAIDYVGHMLEAVRLASSYVDDMDKDGFLADRRTQQAVILNIVIVGEAAGKLAHMHPALLERYPEVPCKSVRGMRNRMAHGYFDIDLSIVWQTVQLSFPVLAGHLAVIEQDLAGKQPGTPGAG